MAIRYGAIFLPGIITPASVAFGALRDALGGDRPVNLRDLAIYAGEMPPGAYGLSDEIAAVDRAVAKAGWERFHLVGYSAGGAVAAAFAAAHGDRLASLTLLEPAWLGDVGISEAERRAFDATVAAADLPGPEAIGRFAQLNLAEGVVPPAPPPGDPPPWMAARPAAIRAIGPALRAHTFDPGRLRALACPVLYVLGSLSNPDLYAERAERARRIFSDFTLEVFEGRHHFDPPHRAEPGRMAALLRAFWDRAEAA